MGLEARGKENPIGYMSLAVQSNHNPFRWLEVDDNYSAVMVEVPIGYLCGG